MKDDFCVGLLVGLGIGTGTGTGLQLELRPGRSLGLGKVGKTGRLAESWSWEVLGSGNFGDR